MSENITPEQLAFTEKAERLFAEFSPGEWGNALALAANYAVKNDAVPSLEKYPSISTEAEGDLTISLMRGLLQISVEVHEEEEIKRQLYQGFGQGEESNNA